MAEADELDELLEELEELEELELDELLDELSGEVLLIVSADFSFLKLAVTVVDLFIFTTQAPEPPHLPPLHLLK